MSTVTDEKQITDQSQIPDAPFYVLMRDRFLSDWGQADGRDAMFLAVCESRDEAEIVAANAEGRGDTDRVEILDHKPQVHREARFGLMTRDECGPWYQAGRWPSE